MMIARPGISRMKYPLSEGTPDALCIHCADPRFQTAFRRFIREELNVQMPMVIALPGVTSHFGMSSALPKNWAAMKSHIRVMTERHAVARVILINHDDCKGYARIADHFRGIAKIVDSQLKHLHGLAEVVQEVHLAHAQIGIYHAHIVDDVV